MFPFALILVIVAIATHTWWVLLGIPVLILVTAPIRRRRWARRHWRRDQWARRDWAC